MIYDIYAGNLITGDTAKSSVTVSSEDDVLLEMETDSVLEKVGYFYCVWANLKRVSGKNNDEQFRIFFACRRAQEEFRSSSGRNYLNMNTGETTGDHVTAMAWYRAGNRVDCWKDGRRTITLNM